MRRFKLPLAAILTVVSTLTVTGCAPKSVPIEPESYTSAGVQASLERAEQYRREGKYAESLREHLWYHKNALKYDEAQTGVRLSFALGDWVDLGHDYPPATDALRAVRDETLVTYRKDPSNALLFDEVMTINLALDDLVSAKSLFYEGRKNAVRDDAFSLDLDRVFQTGDMKWARDVVGDPEKKIDEIKHNRELSRLALSTRKELANEVDGVFAKQIVNLVKAVAKLDGVPAAHKLQEKALTFLNTPEIRDALNPS